MKSTARRISIVFVGIFLFVTAQLLWWNIFFARYTGDSTRTQLHQWRRNQQVMQAFFGFLSPSMRKELLQKCKHLYPHLHCSPPLFSIRVEARGRLLDEEHRFRRMFLFEGCFFFLIFVGGLVLLWMGIRAERELQRRQQNFLSAVSHEMRTPISTMRLLLETLQLRDLNEEKKHRYLDRLQRQLDRLQQTCEQVVAAAMLETKNPTRTLAPEDLNAHLQTIVENARPALEDQGAHIDISLPDQPTPVALDTRALSLIVHNLLENAVKYNPNADKQVRVTLLYEGATARVQIEDNGPGIAPEERQKVFTPFYRVGQELTRQKDGLGLGLYLVKGLTEAMQGHVQYHALPQGSRFTLVWPIAK